jgi:hypothetical protein
VNVKPGREKSVQSLLKVDRGYIFQMRLKDALYEREWDDWKIPVTHPLANDAEIRMLEELGPMKADYPDFEFRLIFRTKDKVIS